MNATKTLRTASLLSLLLLATSLLGGLLLLLVAVLLQVLAPGSSIGTITRLGGLVLLLAPVAAIILALIYGAALGMVHLLSVISRARDLRAQRASEQAVLHRDAHGRAPLLRVPTTGGYVLADPDRMIGAAFGITANGAREFLHPALLPAQAQRNMEVAAIEFARAGMSAEAPQGIWGALEVRQPPTLLNDRPPSTSQQTGDTKLPAFVSLADMIKHSPPSSDHLLLGVTATEAIYTDLGRLMHTGLGGATGWGKSMLSLQLATQLGLCPDVLLAVADPDAVSYQPLAATGRLCLPMPETGPESKHVLEAVQDEIAARYRLIGEGWRVSGTPMQSADDYNCWAVQNGEVLIRPLVLLVDEWPELVQLGAAALANSIVKRGRKAHVYAVLASQGWTRADAGEIGIRRQFHTVYQLGVKEPADARPLVGTDGARRLWERIDAGLFRPGDALLQRAGAHADVFVRVPYIEPQEAVWLLAAMPALDPDGLVSNPRSASLTEQGAETLPETTCETAPETIGGGVEFRNDDTRFSASQSVSTFREHVTIEPERLAHVAALRAQGAGKTAIVRAVWEVTSGPRYQAAAREYEHYAALLDRQSPE